MNDRQPGERVYGALLQLYPRRFRSEYRADMVQLLRDQCTDDPAWQVYGRAALDLAITIPARHLETLMSRPSSHLVPLIYTVLAAGGLVLAAAGGSNISMAVVGLVIACAAGITAAIAWRRSGPMDGRVSTDDWWKLTLAGPCIIAVVIGAGSLGIEAWELGVLAGLVAFVLTGVGLLMGISRLLQRRGATTS